MGSDVSETLYKFSTLLFQFTLPCGERHRTTVKAMFSELISIHAPVWGATCREHHMIKHAIDFNSRSRVGSDKSWVILLFSWVISIHAPVWGATLKFFLIYSNLTLFQFTLPCGERLSSNFASKEKALISIHAPVWGATLYLICILFCQYISIHAPVWGATGKITALKCKL